MIYDLCFVGVGPSTMLALLKLIQKDYKGEIAVVEKGKSLKNRLPSEVVNGFAGSGAFSDSKLSSTLDVGGVIPGLSQYKLTKYEGELLHILNIFNDEEEGMKWDETSKFNTSPSSLSWNKHNTLHVGTDRGRKIYKRIEDYLASFPNIHFFFETEVKEVFELVRGEYELIVDKEPTWLITKNLILATGQKNTLPSRLINQFNLKSTPRAFQLGIRVEDQMNPQYEEIIKANYDFKFVKEYEYENGVKVRIRTFCCNSGNAHTCAEKASEGFTCFNGHAFKELDPNNHTVNYGIMCEVEGLNKYRTKEEQIELMKQVNALDDWYSDNFYNDHKIGEVVFPKRKLLDGFEQLEGLYPKEVIDSMVDFVGELNKLVDLSKAHYLYPETKLSGNIPELNYKTFETKQHNFYMIGDCAISRGIVKASYTGWKFAKEFIKSGH